MGLESDPVFIQLLNSGTSRLHPPTRTLATLPHQIPGLFLSVIQCWPPLGWCPQLWVPVAPGLILVSLVIISPDKSQSFPFLSIPVPPTLSRSSPHLPSYCSDLLPLCLSLLLPPSFSFSAAPPPSLCICLSLPSGRLLCTLGEHSFLESSSHLLPYFYGCSEHMRAGVGMASGGGRALRVLGL